MPLKADLATPSNPAFEEVPIEGVRDYWNARPCNVRHSRQEVGTREYFNEVEQRKYFVEPHIPPFADFPRWRDKRVLEIGCGIGTDTINFARGGARVTAVDLSDRSLELARRRAEIFDVSDRIEFHVGDCEQLDQLIAPQRFDLVYSFGVLHHTPHPERALEHIASLMDRGSELRLMLYTKVSYKLFWIMRAEGVWDMGRIDELIARNSEAQTGCPVTYTYTRGELSRLLHQFEIVEAHKAHIFTWDVESYVRHEYRKDAAWANVNDQQLAELEQELGWHWLIKASLR